MYVFLVWISRSYFYLASFSKNKNNWEVAHIIYKNENFISLSKKFSDEEML